MASEESENPKIFSKKVTKAYPGFNLKGIGSGRELMESLVHHAGRETAKKKRKRTKGFVQNKEKFEILRGLEDGKYCTIRDIPPDLWWKLELYKDKELIDYEARMINSPCSITEKGKEELERLEEEARNYISSGKSYK